MKGLKRRRAFGRKPIDANFYLKNGKDEKSFL
jgi:hypothetical protein